MNASTSERETQRRTGALASAVAEALRTTRTVTRRGSKPYVCAASAGAVLALTLAAVPAPFQAQFLMHYRNLADWERALILSALLRLGEMLTSNSPLA